MAAPQGQSPVDRRFDYLRKKTEQEAGAVEQKAKEDLERGAAARGRLGSGTHVKLKQQQQAQLTGQKQNAIEGVESQREEALFNQQMVDEGRKFQTAERLGAQQFAGSQADLQRRFATGERLGGQDFASQMAQRQMDFTSAESAIQRGFDRGLFDANMDWQKNVFETNDLRRVQEFDANQALATRQLDLDELVSHFNMDAAAKEANKKTMTDEILSWGKSGGGVSSLFGKLGVATGGVTSGGGLIGYVAPKIASRVGF